MPPANKSMSRCCNPAIRSARETNHRRATNGRVQRRRVQRQHGAVLQRAGIERFGFAEEDRDVAEHIAWPEDLQRHASTPDLS